jgi:hypothetical protein
MPLYVYNLNLRHLAPPSLPDDQILEDANPVLALFADVSLVGEGVR